MLIFWVVLSEVFPGAERATVTLTNPTTSLAVLALDGIDVAEVPPRHALELSLPRRPFVSSWRLPDGTRLTVVAPLMPGIRTPEL